jgi:hypothetical protein
MTNTITLVGLGTLFGAGISYLIFKDINSLSLGTLKNKGYEKVLYFSSRRWA